MSDDLPPALRNSRPQTMSSQPAQPQPKPTGQPILQDIPRTPSIPPQQEVTKRAEDYTPQTPLQGATVQRRPIAPQATREQQPPQGLSLLQYTIHGTEMQYVEIKLAPGEAVVGELKNMMYYEAGIRMKTQVIERNDAQGAGFFQKLLGMGKSIVSGARLFMVTFTNVEKEEQKVAFTSSAPGKIIAINLKDMGGSVICENSAFVCAGRRIQINSATQRETGGGVFGSGLTMQKLTGEGMIFLNSGGTINEKTLANGEIINVSFGSVVALQKNVGLRVQSIKNVGLTGEAHRLLQLTGPGKVWLQSLPYNKLQEDITQHTVHRLKDYGLKLKKKKKMWN